MSEEALDLILLIEDEKLAREALTERLGNYGYGVLAVALGEKAVETAAHLDLDLLAILMDIYWENLDGTEVAFRIQKDRPDIPVIIVSGFISEEVRRRTEERQVQIEAWIDKPLIRDNFDALINTLDKLRTQKRSRKPPSSLLPIIHAIEFPPEHYQAGLTILTYFGTIIRQKYPETPVKIGIEQEGLMVRMIIESPDGEELQRIERTLQEYGLVVTGEITPEAFLSDPFQVTQLKHKLEMAHLELKHQRDLLQIAHDHSHEKGRQMQDLESEIKELRRLFARSLENSLVREDQLLEHLEKLIAQHHGTIREALGLIRKKIEGGISPEEENDIQQALATVGAEEPALLRRLKEHAYGALSSATGNKLYLLIMRILGQLPQ